jgi:hypothetical protein
MAGQSGDGKSSCANVKRDVCVERKDNISPKKEMMTQYPKVKRAVHLCQFFPEYKLCVLLRKIRIFYADPQLLYQELNIDEAALTASPNCSQNEATMKILRMEYAK